MRLVFHNPRSGPWWIGRQRQRVLALLAQDPQVRLIETERGGMAAQVRAVLDPETTAVIACGGDGTVADVAAGLAGSGVPLGIIPCGTTNVLAREFGIPLNPLRAAALLATGGPCRPLRTWTAGSGRLVLGAGVGWDARLMVRTSPAAKRRLGLAAVAAAGLPLMLGYDFPRLTVEGVDLEGAAVTATGTSVLVANARYWAGRNAAIPMADPGDALLEVILLERVSRLQLAAFWALMGGPGGAPLRLPGVRTLQMRSLTVSSDAPGGTEVHLNGDPAGRTPLTIRPAGLVQVRVPAA